MTPRMTGMMRPPGRPDCLGPRPHPVWRLPPLQLTNTLTALVFKSFGFTIMSIQDLYHHRIFSIFMTFYEANKPLLVDSIILFVISYFHSLCSSLFDEMCVVSAECGLRSIIFITLFYFQDFCQCMFHMFGSDVRIYLQYNYSHKAIDNINGGIRFHIKIFVLSLFVCLRRVVTLSFRPYQF